MSITIGWGVGFAGGAVTGFFFGLGMMCIWAFGSMFKR